MTPQLCLSLSSKRKLKHLSHTQDQCITTALDCVRKELNGTVRDECEDPKERINDALAFLDGLIEERLGKSR
ncbi:hypothetical protein FQN60_009949, partial [Etheostoma spectabile]